MLTVNRQLEFVVRLTSFAVGTSNWAELGRKAEEKGWSWPKRGILVHY